VVLVSWVLLVLLGGLTACKGAPDFPTDAELRLTFHDKHGVFERLLAMLNEDDADGYMCVIRMHGPRKAEYEALMHEIGVKAISCSRNRDYVRFLVAEYAHFGFHHDEKGFVYDPKPHEMLVVEELPASACGGRSGRWNPWWTRSRLDAHWYIYWTHED
jgi:hypothetical protein